ncbi:MAG: methyltransferase domain-containing protein [Candidatus Lokiarchaeota archaeon]|nr:methyltransferase domain-containing protein [Candidatus Lokiarchaeota archaeon]
MTRYVTPFSMLHAISLLTHTTRIKKFRQAIERVVTRNSFCIDVGTGSGILAILAAKKGARKVTAIDINAESLEYAKKSAERNNVADRIDFVNSHFDDFIPAEKADVVMCEMLSSMLLIEQQIPASKAIIKNMLKDDGYLLPSNVSIFITPVESFFHWNRFIVEDIVFPRVPQTTSKEAVRDLSDLQKLAEFNLQNGQEEMVIKKTQEFEIDEEGVLHGIVGMFEANLVPEITLRMEDGWRELFLPFREAIEVKSGDILQVDISFTPGKFDSLKLFSRIV